MLSKICGPERKNSACLDNLTDRLGRTLNNLRGRGRLTEDNIKESFARGAHGAVGSGTSPCPVVRQFIENVREKAMGEDVLKSLTPGQMLVKIVNDELVSLMGEANEGPKSCRASPPAVIFDGGIAGLR